MLAFLTIIVTTFLGVLVGTAWLIWTVSRPVARAYIELDAIQNQAITFEIHEAKAESESKKKNHLSI